METVIDDDSADSSGGEFNWKIEIAAGFARKLLYDLKTDRIERQE